jgi:hypothetical protein
MNTDYMSKTQVKNILKKAGIRISQSLKGRVCAYNTTGVIVENLSYAETLTLGADNGWVSAFYFKSNPRSMSANHDEQRELLKSALEANGFEVQGSYIRKMKGTK